jgi:hypothetical protein
VKSRLPVNHASVHDACHNAASIFRNLQRNALEEEYQYHFNMVLGIQDKKKKRHSLSLSLVHPSIGVNVNNDVGGQVMTAVHNKKAGVRSYRSTANVKINICGRLHTHTILYFTESYTVIRRVCCSFLWCA